MGCTRGGRPGLGRGDEEQGFCGLSLCGLKDMDGVSLRLAVIEQGLPLNGSR